MSFSLNLSFSDLLLLLPEIILTCWLCVVITVDFVSPRLPKERLAYLSVGGLLATLGCLAWFDMNQVSGTLFGNMFVLDRMAIFQDIHLRVYDPRHSGVDRVRRPVYAVPWRILCAGRHVRAWYDVHGLSQRSAVGVRQFGVLNTRILYLGVLPTG